MTNVSDAITKLSAICFTGEILVNDIVMTEIDFNDAGILILLIPTNKVQPDLVQ